MRGGARLVSNTAVNAVASAVVAVVAIILTPFLLDRLGQEEYGVWALATMLTFGNGLGGIADLGLQQAAVRFVASARGQGDAQRISQVTSTLLVSFAVIGAAVAAALGLASGVLVDLFGVAPELESAARIVFALVAAQIAIEVPAAAFLAVLEGAEAYPSLRIVDTGPRVTFAIVAGVVVSQGGGVVAMTVASLAISAIAAVMAVLLARRTQPDAPVSPGRADRATFRELVRYGGQFLFLRIAGLVYRYMDRVILAVVIAASALAEYDVVYRIHAVAAMALAIAPSAIMPAAAFLGARAEASRLRGLYLRGSRYATALCAPVAIGAIVFAPELLRTWVGPEYEHLAGATRLFLLYPLFVSVHTIGSSMFYGLGLMGPVIRLVLPTTLANLVVSVVLVNHIGLNGVMWGTLAGYGIVWLPYLRLFMREFDVGLADWLRGIVLPNVPGALVQVAFALSIRPLVDSSSSLLVPVAAVGASIVVSFLVFWFVMTGADERANFRSRIRPTEVPSAE